MTSNNPHDNNDTNIDEREAVLTAYALGETDDAQTAEVESLLANDDAARAHVEDIRVTAALLTSGFEAEAPERLPAESRAAVTAAATEEPAPAGRMRSLWPLVGMAASIAAGVGLAGWMAQRPRHGVETAGGIAVDYRIDGGPELELQQSARPHAKDSAALAAGYGEAQAELVDLARERDAQAAARLDGAPAPSGPVAVPAREPPAVGHFVGGVREAGGRFASSGGDGSDGGRRGAIVVGGGYRGPGGEVPPDSRAPSTPPSPAKPGDGTVETFNRERPAATAVAADSYALGGAIEQAKPPGGAVLQGSSESIAAHSAQLEEQLKVLVASGDVRLVRRFSADTVLDLDAIEAEAVQQAYAELTRRRQGERLRDRHGLRYGVPGSEDYAHPGESTFRDPAEEPLSTFSIDVDTASYANVRRFLNNGQLPPPAAVRVEEMINYFSYSDPRPQGEHPLSATIESATCPWNTGSRLVRVGVKAKTFDEPPPAANLVFLIDVSGSMRSADKLPLLQRAMKMLTDQMREGDRVAIVTYANNAGVRLQSTDGSEKDAIKACIDGLSAGGGTNGGGGIVDAYRIARENLIEGGTNRVILATDGDFNVGVTDRNELNSLIESQRESGVFLSVLGVGTGNLKDATLESLADRGNGNYHYLDGLREARKVLVDDLMGTMVTVAKDVKIQIEFNPVTVGAYRLIGYENRMLAAADFNNDAKDAGEMGAGHTVTALYEVVPAGTSTQAGVDPLRYQKSPPAEATDAAKSGELMTLKVRYKLPTGTESTKFEMSGKDTETKFDDASEDLRFSSAVASFGMLLRGSPTAAGTSYDAVLELAQSAVGEDRGGHRAEFLDLVLKAKTLSGR